MPEPKNLCVCVCGWSQKTQYKTEQNKAIKKPQNLPRLWLFFFFLLLFVGFFVCFCQKPTISCEAAWPVWAGAVSVGMFQNASEQKFL